MYPNFSLVPEKLQRILCDNKLVSSVVMKNYELWSNVVFSKTLNYDFTPDQTELIKDSALAPPFKYWYTMFDKCCFKYRYNKKCPVISQEEKDKFTTRTIESFLKSEEDYIYKLVNKIELGIVDEDDHMAVQCPKERELKGEGGRAFTKQTPDQRFRQTSMEYNIAHQIFPYVPEQSMISGEISNTLKMLSHIKEMQKGNAVMVCLDLKKWCNFQRSSTTIFCSQMLDDLFGTKGLYTNSHNYFVSCNILVNNRLCSPDYEFVNGRYIPLPGPYYTNRNRGGLEGLQQKKWTMIAASVIKYVIEQFNANAISMGQGDNQIIILSLTKENTPEAKKKLIDDFLDKLSTTFKEINHELKDKETWYSTSLYEYIKLRFFKGSFISQGTKKSVRLLPDINDGLFSIPSSISTINTMTEAIARGDPYPHMAFIMNQMLVINYILRKNIIQGNNLHRPRNNNELWEKIRAAMVFPSDFGGLPLSTLYTHTLRGHDDKLTLWFSLFKTAQKYKQFHLISQAMQNTWQTYPSVTPSTSKERERLFMDPFCLNITNLPSAEYVLRDLTTEYLQSDQVTNPMITIVIYHYHLKDFLMHWIVFLSFILP